MKFTADLATAAWIAPRLGEFATVSGVVPRGFAACLRIFHPFSVQGRDGWLDGVRLAHLVGLLAPAATSPGVTIGVWDG